MVYLNMVCRKIVIIALSIICALVNVAGAQEFKIRPAYQTATPLMLKREGVMEIKDQKEAKKVLDSAYYVYHTLPGSEIDNSTFRYMQLSDSCSRKGDTITAGEYFLHIDPYHVISILDQTRMELDSFFARFALNEETKSTYQKKYKDAVARHNSSVYDSLKQFYFYSKQLIKELDSVSSAYKVYYEKLLKKTDSVQFAYLRNYLKRKGWPSLANGSLFAVNIASRDIEHYVYYLSYLKEAFYNQQVSLNMISKVADNDRYYYGYIRVKKSLERPHTCHDVSAYKDKFKDKFLLSPALSEDIFTDIKNHCVVKDYFFVYYAKDPRRAAKRWVLSDVKKTECWDIIKRVSEICPKHDSHENGNGVHIYLPNTIYMRDKEFLCVIYE